MWQLRIVCFCFLFSYVTCQSNYIFRRLVSPCANVRWIRCQADLNSFPLGELEETTETPQYYMDEDYPAGPGIIEPLPEWSNWCGSESSTLENDVYIWHYALIVVHARNEWMNEVMITSPRTCQDVVDLLYNLLHRYNKSTKIEVIEFALIQYTRASVLLHDKQRYALKTLKIVCLCSR